MRFSIPRAPLPTSDWRSIKWNSQSVCFYQRHSLLRLSAFYLGQQLGCADFSQKGIAACSKIYRRLIPLLWFLNPGFYGLLKSNRNGSFLTLFLTLHLTLIQEWWIALFCRYVILSKKFRKFTVFYKSPNFSKTSGMLCDAVVSKFRKWHSRGQRFDPAILHHKKGRPNGRPFLWWRIGAWENRPVRSAAAATAAKPPSAAKRRRSRRFQCSLF